MDHAWLDEGLNTFSTARVIAERFTPNFYSDRFFGGFIPWVHRSLPLTRAAHDGISAYRRTAESDVQSRPTWQYFPATARGITYNRTALWLHTLERLLGWPTLQRILVDVLRALALSGIPRPQISSRWPTRSAAAT